jgi:hypothetical protein
MLVSRTEYTLTVALTSLASTTSAVSFGLPARGMNRMPSEPRSFVVETGERLFA